MNNFIFTCNGEKKLKKLDKINRERIIKKLIFLKEKDENSSFFKNLYGFEHATHRIRVGNYRIILKKEKNNYYIVDIGHRKDIYK